MKKPKPPEPTKRGENLSVRVSPELKTALARVAASEERTISQMAEIVLRRWLQEKGELKDVYKRQVQGARAVILLILVKLRCCCFGNAAASEGSDGSG